MIGTMSRRLRVESGSLRAGSREIDGDSYHYLFRVRRLRVGDSLVLFDGAGMEASATVEEVSTQRATLRVAEPVRHEQTTSYRLTVAQALLKGDRMDWCFQKLTELGAHELIPLRTARTVVDVRGERAKKRHRRFEHIVADAARQCRRTWVPQVNEISDLDELWLRAADFELPLLLWEGEHQRPLGTALPDTAPSSICLLIGPEGGFEDEEVARARAAGFVAVGLGRHILRAETAALAAATVIGFQFGDLGG